MGDHLKFSFYQGILSPQIDSFFYKEKEVFINCENPNFSLFHHTEERLSVFSHLVDEIILAYFQFQNHQEITQIIP